MLDLVLCEVLPFEVARSQHGCCWDLPLHQECSLWQVVQGLLGSAAALLALSCATCMVQTVSPTEQLMQNQHNCSNLFQDLLSTAILSASHCTSPASLKASRIRVSPWTRLLDTILHCLGDRSCIAAALCSLKPLYGSLKAGPAVYTCQQAYVLQSFLYAYARSLSLVYMCNTHIHITCVLIHICEYTQTTPFKLRQVQHWTKTMGTHICTDCTATVLATLTWSGFPIADPART